MLVYVGYNIGYMPFVCTDKLPTSTYSTRLLHFTALHLKFNEFERACLLTLLNIFWQTKKGKKTETTTVRVFLQPNRNVNWCAPFFVATSLCDCMLLLLLSFHFVFIWFIYFNGPSTNQQDIKYISWFRAFRFFLHSFCFLSPRFDCYSRNLILKSYAGNSRTHKLLMAIEAQPYTLNIKSDNCSVRIVCWCCVLLAGEHITQNQIAK